MPPSADKAIFISYSRDDAAAARRVAEALRSSGLEVWFDESELRGGDAWDANIRRQIKECTLFLPIVSASTQERGEGYFRLEWKLAVERTHLMAEGMPFLAPVVVDATREDNAAVPAEFMRVQWMRLPGALPTPEFVTQVQRLLVAPRKPHLSHPASAPAASSPAPRGPARPMAVVSVVALLAIAAAVYFALRRPAAPAAVTASPAAPAPPTVPPVFNKSIAVLPFENRSADKDANAFFADGIHEDIITNLAQIADLRVISRTSVMEYRGTTKKIRQIGQELGVAWLLEGSVQRVGNKVRVTGQLINARTDEHVWAESYDRDLTDIFAIQSALAQEIARALSATLSPREKQDILRAPTKNLAAYELYRQAGDMETKGNDTRDQFEAEIALLNRAVTLDPEFAQAWALLAMAHAEMRFGSYDTSPARLASARAAIDTAVRLAPDSPHTIGGLALFYYYGSRDYPRALEQLERYRRQWPNNYLGSFWQGLVQRRQGKWVESLANLRHAAELDPKMPDVARNITMSLRAMRRYDEAIAEQTRRVALVPDSLLDAAELARLHFLARGTAREFDDLLAGSVALRSGRAMLAGYRKHRAAITGDFATAAQLDREFPDEWGETYGGGRIGPWRSATLALALGDKAGARARAESGRDEVRAKLAEQPENPVLHVHLAMYEAVLGRKTEALAAAHRSLELLPESVDAFAGTLPRWGLVVTLAWTGDKAAACAELRRLLAEPSNTFVNELRSSPWLLPLKGYPEFEAILNDPKNNAPLF